MFHITDEDFITSDDHWGHANILSFTARPYDTLDEMNNGLVRRWVQAVTNPQARVFVVGDIVMGNREQSLEFVKQLTGQIFLIPGNHDDVHPMYADKKNYAKKVAMYEAAGITILPVQVEAEYNGTEFRMCHFPYDGDSREGYDDRYPEWRPTDDGMLLLHGHTHSPERYRGHQIHVGVDAWDCTPRLFSDILAGYTYQLWEF